MGSRAVVVIGRDAAAAEVRFGIAGPAGGTIYTRTGRPFFSNETLEREFLDRLRGALDRAGFWDHFSTSWACFDAELMPWSSKAQELLRSQYAAVGSASRRALGAAADALEAASARGGAPVELVEHFRARQAAAEAFVSAYRQYCWPVQGISDFKLAPFHLLATEGAVHMDKDHVWHMDQLAQVCAADPDILFATPYRVVDLGDPESETAATEWWLELTARGGEGMVVKPLSWIVRGRRGLVQPAVKCRGREYLRIIYGAEYTAPEHLARLRARGLSAKRSLALREFVLGLEALHRFVEKEPLYRIHECAFGVLALESEPVDPRL